MSVPAFSRFAYAYGMAFGLFYVVARVHGLALFTVYPSLGVVLLGMHRSRDVADPAMAFLAPEMWWYGWVASAALGAFVIGLVAALLPDRWWRGFWLGWVWVTPLIAMIGCVYPDFSLVSTITVWSDFELVQGSAINGLAVALIGLVGSRLSGRVVSSVDRLGLGKPVRFGPAR